MPSVSNVVLFQTMDGATTYDTVADFALTLESWDAQKPGGKWEYIDVPGAAGSLDVSRALSQDVPPKTRTLVFNFGVTTGEHSQAVAAVDAVAAALHLQKMRIQTPDDASAGLWYVGNCEITNFEYVGTGARIEVTAECEPYRYSATGGTLTAQGASAGHLDAAKILTVPDACRTYARLLVSKYTVNSVRRIYADGIAYCFADNSNLFDLDNATLRGVTVRANTTSWVKSNNIAQDGQRVAFGGVNVGWVERAAVIATSASVIPITGGARIFPFAEDTRARVWLYSGTVTAVQSSVTAGGQTYSAGAYLHCARSASGTIGADAVYNEGATFSAYGTIAAPSVGGEWSGQYLDFAIDPETTVIYIDIAGVTAPDVYALIAFYKAGETAPAAWTAPNVQVRALQLPYQFVRTYDYETQVTDTDVYTSYIDCSVFSSQVAGDDITLARIEDEPGAAYIQAVPVNSSGEIIRDTWGYLLTELTAYQSIDYTVDAGAQPVYPTATTPDDAGAVVSYNGSTYLLERGTATELDTLFNRGANVITVATAPNFEVVFTWPLGVL